MKRLLLIFFMILSLPGVTEDDENGWGIAGFPIIFSRPETGIAIGAGGIIYRRHQGDYERFDRLGLVGYYTQKKQYNLGGEIERYIKRFKMFLLTHYTRFPDRFWGIGPDTDRELEEAYTSLQFTIRGDILWQITGNNFLGPVFRVSNFDVKDTEEGGMLETGAINGSAGAMISGGGIKFLWDGRDNTFATYDGGYFLLKAILYRRWLGSDDNCSHLEIDIRRFFEIFDGNVLAIQGRLELTDGLVPFQVMPKLGGANILRGYYKGRYIDKVYLATQAEYWFPIFWRFRGAVFGALGQVGPTLNQLAFDDPKYAGGFGLRYVWSKDDRIHVRFDCGFSEEGVEFYLDVLEAF